MSSEYWKNHFNAQAERFPASPLKQVDRTINGVELDSSQMDLTIDSIRQALSLGENDRVVDLCCGNGVITREIAKSVQYITGIDFSDVLIENANKYSVGYNIKYVTANVAELQPDIFVGANKVYMRDSVQFFTSDQLLGLLHSLSRAPSVAYIYIAGVPDAELLEKYYDSESKMAFYREREKSGKPHIGNWWSHTDMQSLVEASGLNVRFISQHPALCSSYYRYDCLVQKII